MAEQEPHSRVDKTQGDETAIMAMQQTLELLVTKVTDIERKYEGLAQQKTKGGRKVSAKEKNKDSREVLSISKERVRDYRTREGSDESDDQAENMSEKLRPERVSEMDNSPNARPTPEREDDAESEFYVSLPSPSEETDMNSDVFAQLEAELEKQEAEGEDIAERLANITTNRFSVRMPERKLKEKMDFHLIPKNCSAIKAPSLNEEIMEKGNLDRFAKRTDNSLMSVQHLIAKATAAIVHGSSNLHKVTLELTKAGTQRTAATAATGSERTAQTTRFVEIANKMLSAVGDAIALLGAAHQQLSAKRRTQLQAVLPRDIASICNNESIPVTDKLFGGDIDKAIKTAKESFKLKTQFHASPFRAHPYHRKGQNTRPFLGQGSPYNQRGNYSLRGRNPRPSNQRGTGKFKGRHH